MKRPLLQESHGVASQRTTFFTITQIPQEMNTVDVEMRTIVSATGTVAIIRVDVRNGHRSLRCVHLGIVTPPLKGRRQGARSHTRRPRAVVDLHEEESH
jgi:hypothetical protein